MSKIQTVWVYADAAERYADLIAGARRFGAVVMVVQLAVLLLSVAVVENALKRTFGEGR